MISSEDGVGHQVFVIREDADIAAIHVCRR